MPNTKRFSKTRQAQACFTPSGVLKVTTVRTLQARVVAAVAAAGHPACRVLYHAYELAGDGRPLDNLDVTAATGKIILVTCPDDDAPHYQSSTLYEPSWLEVAVAVNQLLLTTGWDRYSFEGLEETMPAQTSDAAELLRRGVELYEVLLGE